MELAKAPLPVKIVDLQNFARLALGLSEEVLFIWHFKREEKHIIGTCIPFEHYYDADALPLFPQLFYHCNFKG